MTNTGDIFRSTFFLYKKYLKEIIFINSVIALFSFLDTFLPHKNVLVNVFSFVAQYAIYIFLLSTLLLFIHSHETHHPLSLKTSLIKARTKFLRVYLTDILCSSIFVLGIIFLFIPGIIFLIIFGQAFYIALFENKTPLQALSLSRTLTFGKRLTIFTIYTSIVLFLAGWMLIYRQFFAGKPEYIFFIITGSVIMVLNYALWSWLTIVKK